MPGSNRRQSPPLGKNQQLLVLGVACACICLSVVVMAVACFLFFSGTSTQVPVKESPVGSTDPPITCVDCELLSVPKDDPLLKKLTMAEEDGVLRCCAFQSEQMSALLELSMRRQEENIALPQFNASDFKFSPISAHKRLYQPSEIGSSDEVPYFFDSSMVKCQFLKEDDNIKEHARGVEVLNNGLKIVKEGLYFIYSSIEFRPDSNQPCRNFKFQTWEHNIMRNPSSPSERNKVLLQTIHTCCDICVKEDETSFTSGVFYLRKNDVIHIEIQAQGLVHFRNDSSFAGMMMLGGGGEENLSDDTHGHKR